MSIWRSVPGSNGNYEISISTKEGKCRSLNWRAHKGVIREFTNTPDKNNGRIYWHLTIDGKSIHQQSARWIAITYPELVQNEFFPGAVIDHVDTDVTNNHPSNLRWVTPKENSNNPITIKHLKEGHKGIHPSEKTKELKRENHPKKRQVAKVSPEGEIVAIYRSIREAERQTGLPASNICLCCKGVYKTIGGFKWIYYSSSPGM